MIIEVPAYDPDQLPEPARHKDRGLHRIQRTPITTSIAKRPTLLIALVESDPMRLVGLRALLESELDLEIISALLPEIAIKTNIDVVLIGDRSGRKLFDTMSSLNLMRPNLPVLVIGPRADDEIMLNAIVCGAKGYVFDGSPPSEFARAIRVVSEGSVWASRRVLSMFVDLAITHPKRLRDGAKEIITAREKQVLRMLVTGLSNKEIGAPLGIAERTVKAHIAKMMRKVGVHNRIELSIHAVAHSLVTLPAELTPNHRGLLTRRRIASLA
jgi:DNA-binding NarL/FixJ family response regulator